jgi:HPt (histidine-containing phosphotransfer) domain-containing protein
MSGDSVELIVEMIGIFEVQVKEIQVEMQQNLDNKNYDALGKLAHKAKSSVAIMGMDTMSKKLKELELLTKNNDKIEKYQEYIDLFTIECEEAVKELHEFQKSL